MKKHIGIIKCLFDEAVMQGFFIALIFIMFACLILYIGVSTRKNEAIKDSYIGKTIVLNNDTLIIVDHSRDHYVLSNNLKVNRKLIEK